MTFSNTEIPHRWIETHFSWSKDVWIDKMSVKCHLCVYVYGICQMVLRLLLKNLSCQKNTWFDCVFCLGSMCSLAKISLHIHCTSQYLYQRFVLDITNSLFTSKAINRRRHQCYVFFANYRLILLILHILVFEIHKFCMLFL